MHTLPENKIKKFKFINNTFFINNYYFLLI